MPLSSFFVIDLFWFVPPLIPCCLILLSDWSLVQSFSCFAFLQFHLHCMLRPSLSLLFPFSIFSFLVLFFYCSNLQFSVSLSCCQSFCPSVSIFLLPHHPLFFSHRSLLATQWLGRAIAGMAVSLIDIVHPAITSYPTSTSPLLCLSFFPVGTMLLASVVMCFLFSFPASRLTYSSSFLFGLFYHSLYHSPPPSHFLSPAMLLVYIFIPSIIPYPSCNLFPPHWPDLIGLDWPSPPFIAIVTVTVVITLLITCITSLWFYCPYTVFPSICVILLVFSLLLWVFK